MSHHHLRRTHFPALLCLVATATAVLVLPATVQAATSASGSQSVTADVANTLEATFPGAYAWGSLDAGAAANTSSTQTVNVKSNQTWGVKASTDQTGGQMKEWTGAAYVAVTPKVLTNALTWKVSQIGATPQVTTYAAFTSTPALATGTQAITSDSGTDVSFLFKQLISYADTSAGANDYRVLVNYDVAQGW